MLMDQPIPSYVGKGAPIANAGDMQNQGVELEITYKNNIGDLNFSITGQATYIKNKLINMGNDTGENVYESSDASGVGSFVKGTNGMVFPYFYGFKTAGIIQNQSEADTYNTTYGQKAKPGDVRFVDHNNDGILDDLDRTMIGKGMPDVTYGINIAADYKNFDLNIFFQGSAGNDIFDISQRGDIAAMNRPSWVLDRWTAEGTSNKIPRVTAENLNANWRSSDLLIKDGSYIRLKNIQLGYTVPTGLVRQDMVNRIRVYVSAENLLTYTKYDGFEPEIAAGGYTTIGVDKGIYPQSRTFSIGANITF